MSLLSPETENRYNAAMGKPERLPVRGTQLLPLVHTLPATIKPRAVGRG
jgi:hypothetical protein